MSLVITAYIYVLSGQVIGIKIPIGVLRMHRQCKRRRGEASKLQHQLHLALAAAKHWRGGSMAGRWHAARHH